MTHKNDDDDCLMVLRYSGRLFKMWRFVYGKTALAPSTKRVG